MACQDQGGNQPVHAQRTQGSTFSARSYSASRSAIPLVPPLMRLVMVRTSPLTKGTQDNYRKGLRQIRKAFTGAPIDALTPQVIAQYRDARKAKVRANREIALLHVHIRT